MNDAAYFEDSRMDLYELERWLRTLEISPQLVRDVIADRRAEELALAAADRDAAATGGQPAPVHADPTSPEDQGIPEDVSEQVQVIDPGYRLSRTAKQEFPHLAALTEPVRVQDVSTATLGAAHAALTEKFPWVAAPLRRLLRPMQWRLAFGQSAVRLPPTLLVGESGSGKSRLTMDIARALSLPAIQIQASGDAKVLEGTSAGWSTTRPSVPLEFVASSGVANAMIIVDELDKVDPDDRHNGNLLDVLLALLEPQTARAYWDPCLRAQADLSRLNWLFTANSTRNLPAHLLSRLLVLKVDRPAPEHLHAVIRSVYADLASDLGVPVELLPRLQPHHRSALVAQWQGGVSLRAARRMIEHLMMEAMHHATLH